MSKKHLKLNTNRISSWKKYILLPKWGSKLLAYPLVGRESKLITPNRLRLCEETFSSLNKSQLHLAQEWLRAEGQPEDPAIKHRAA